MELTKFAGFDLLDMEDEAATGSADYGRWLIHGAQGSGKTTLASTIANLGPTLFVDLMGEKGVRSFKGAPYAKNIKIIRPKSVAELDDLQHTLAAGNHPFVATIIDSATSVQKMSMKFLQGYDETAVREIRRGASGASMQTWGQSLEIMNDLALFWFALADGDKPRPMHVIMTAQTKMIENELTGEVARTPDVQKGAVTQLLASPDYVVYTDLVPNMDAISDPNLPPFNHVARFGADPGYRTKARIPFELRGKIPSVLGAMGNAPDLAQLSRILQIGGTTPAPAADAA